VKVYNEPYTFDLDNFEFSSTISGTILEIIKEGWKPYLRPMSSMTEEEDEEYRKRNLYGFHWDFVDWCNSKHFDYRGLIKLGLALESPEVMYK
jgi:hypothetical protein